MHMKLHWQLFLNNLHTELAYRLLLNTLAFGLCLAYYARPARLESLSAAATVKAVLAPADADGNGQNNHAAITDHFLPACASRGRQAHLLHSNGAGDGEGAGGAARAGRLPQQVFSGAWRAGA